ncbi:hypothetical protein NKR23_g262 [Pleurostoma richardsiae]|uniref:Uncharacterized protein n=1 Tax=Pleurostoma richardsiae TaxID=41990 RepID=A0AA38S7X3_9PEZI|nr:hypothetical protein NKR23_g262 [Pleurostoma richardsiae]
MSAAPKTVFFLGAPGGSGSSALRRDPLRWSHLHCAAPHPGPPREARPFRSPANLHTEKDNAVDIAEVARCVVHPAQPFRLVDSIVFCIGGVFSSKLDNDDPTKVPASHKRLGLVSKDSCKNIKSYNLPNELIDDTEMADDIDSANVEVGSKVDWWAQPRY